MNKSVSKTLFFSYLILIIVGIALLIYGMQYEEPAKKPPVTTTTTTSQEGK